MERRSVFNSWSGSNTQWRLLRKFMLKKGKTVPANSFQRPLKSARISPIDRHTFASHAVQRAETIPMVGRLLGHAKVSSTLRYAHLDDAHALAASQCIADAIGKMMDDGLPQVYPTTKYDALDWTHGSPAE
jgi:site-specific recombinase XerC